MPGSTQTAEELEASNSKEMRGCGWGEGWVGERGEIGSLPRLCEGLQAMQSCIFMIIENRCQRCGVPLRDGGKHDTAVERNELLEELKRWIRKLNVNTVNVRAFRFDWLSLKRGNTYL